MTSPSVTDVQHSTPAPVAPEINLDAEIERAKQLLDQLNRQKAEVAKQQAKQREGTIQEFQKRLGIDARGLMAFLKALDTARTTIGAKSDADLSAAMAQLNELMGTLKINSTKDLAIMVRNRMAASSKAKRLDEDTLALLRKVLERGAKIPEVAKHFGLSLATVNARKKAWKLTGRKNVPLVSLKEAMKGLT